MANVLGTGVWRMNGVWGKNIGDDVVFFLACLTSKNPIKSVCSHLPTPHLEGQGDLVSRFITPIPHIAT